MIALEDVYEMLRDEGRLGQLGDTVEELAEGGLIYDQILKAFVPQGGRSLRWTSVEITCEEG